MSWIQRVYEEPFVKGTTEHRYSQIGRAGPGIVHDIRNLFFVALASSHLIAFEAVGGAGAELDFIAVRRDINVISRFFKAIWPPDRDTGAVKSEEADDEILVRYGQHISSQMSAVLPIADNILESLQDILDKDSEWVISHRENLGTVYSSVSQTIAFIEELLRFVDGKEEFVELNQGISDLGFFITHMLEKNIHFELNLRSCSCGVVQIRRIDLQRILLNLTVNARRAMRGFGTLTISTEAQAAHSEAVMHDIFAACPNRMLLSVLDTGCGMEADVLSRVTEYGFTTKRSKGNGLGMSIVHDLVHSYGGELRVKSKLFKGTCWYLSFPVT